MPKAIDLTGRKYNNLTVLARAANIGQHAAWACRCVCGTLTVVRSNALTSGATKSCGCLREKGRAPTHGRRNTPEYTCWINMHDKCRNKNAQQFKNYGERGIRVCDEWSSFEAFFNDMGPRPSPKHSLDRINNDGDYTPSNCRWATWTQQANNRRKRCP